MTGPKSIEEIEAIVVACIGRSYEYVKDITVLDVEMLLTQLAVSKQDAADLNRRLSDEQQNVLAVLKREAEVEVERETFMRRALAAEAALRTLGYDWPVPEPDAECFDVVVADDRSWIDTDE